ALHAVFVALCLAFVAPSRADEAPADAGAASAPALPAGLTLESKPPADPAILTGTLDNGLRWYVLRNEKPKDRVELRLAVKVGSVQETDEERGLAHFNEHMSFNGSAHFKSGELVSYLETIGSRFGAD